MGGHGVARVRLDRRYLRIRLMCSGVSKRRKRMLWLQSSHPGSVLRSGPTGTTRIHVHTARVRRMTRNMSETGLSTIMARRLQSLARTFCKTNDKCHVAVRRHCCIGFGEESDMSNPYPQCHGQASVSQGRGFNPFKPGFADLENLPISQSDCQTNHTDMPKKHYRDRHVCRMADYGSEVESATPTFIQGSCAFKTSLSISV